MKSPKKRLVEKCLRYKVLFSNRSNRTMNLLDQMDYYKVRGVSISIIDNGKIDWTDVYGVADSKSKKNLTQNTLFQAGSISKSIATIGILYLVHKGLISLDENVNQYLKSWKCPENEFTLNEKVTLRRILSHSAGLTVPSFPGYSIDASVPSLVQVLDGIKPPANTEAVRVNQTPGVSFRYSGGGTTIAQLIVEYVTNQPFHQWIEDNVFNQLGMSSSTFNQYPDNHKSLASGHDSNGDPIYGNHHIYPEMAAAGLWSTSSDIAKFVIYLQNAFYEIDQSFIDGALIMEMLTPQIHVMGRFHSGLGIFLEKRKDEIIFEHGGQDEGFIALYRGLLKQRCGFVILMNADANGWYLMEEISNSIADTYQWNGFDPIYRKSVEAETNIDKKLLGTYQSEENKKISIQIDNEELYLQEQKEMPKIKLHLDENNHYFT